MAVIKYERGKDGVTRESVSNDGGKTFTQTNANSSNGYSGSGASKNPTGGAGSDYGKYNEKQYNNQKAYLDALSKNGTSGQKSWAQNELNNLETQYRNQGNGGFFMQTNPDGSGETYKDNDAGNWDTSGQKWTNVGGTQGVNYAISGDNGTIIATDSNGVQTRFLPTSADYNSFYQNMMSDIKNAGNSYIPQNTFTNQNGTYTTKDYTAGNSDLQYALQQAAKTNPGISVGDYAESLYNRVGSTRSDGSMVTLDDVTKELTRLGLSDYLPGNAVFTSGQNLLPGNEFGRFGEDATGDEGQWYFYGGQQYRVGGDQDNFVDYVNGKTGNLKNNLSYIFNDMANNPYAQQDPEFLNAYLQGQGQFNTANGSITGNNNVDNVINYVNSMNNYNQATGGSMGSSSLLEMIQGYLNSGLQANQDFIAQQRAMAEQQAQRQASDAYVNMVLAGDAAKEQMSALGLGTTGALQSALMGVQGNYGNNLATIDQNLSAMINSLSEQELQVLSDYYNNMTKYAYDVTQYEAEQAYRNAQLALQQQQAQYEQQMAQQQLALQLQQWQWQQEQAAQQYAFDQRQYEDTLAQQEFENNLALQQLQQALKKSSGGSSGSSGGSYSGYTANPAGVVEDASPVLTGEAVQADPAVAADWQTAINNTLVDSQMGMNLLGGLSQATQVQTPAVDINQLVQESLANYNNAVNGNIPASSAGWTELLQKLKNAAASVGNIYY